MLPGQSAAGTPIVTPDQWLMNRLLSLETAPTSVSPRPWKSALQALAAEFPEAHALMKSLEKQYNSVPKVKGQGPQGDLVVDNGHATDLLKLLRGVSPAEGMEMLTNMLNVNFHCVLKVSVFA